MAHCSTLVLHCMDFRFVSGIQDFLKSIGKGGNHDLVAAAGAAKNLADPYDTKDPEFVLRQIEIARKLHGTSEVVLINHRGCGAYGTGTFATPEEEHARHVRDLTKAARVIEHRFPGLTTLNFFARLNSDGSVDFEKVE